jgi:hypothetical protein
MDWVKAYQVYMGLKLHFTTPSYDYMKYGPKKIAEESCAKYFVMLNAVAGEFEDQRSFEQHLIGVFRNKIVWLNELYSTESKKKASDYLSELDSFAHNLETDVGSIKFAAVRRGCEFGDMFKCENEFAIPPVTRLMIQGAIKMHSYAALDSALGFNQNINQMVFDVRKMEKYKQLHAFKKGEIAALAMNIIKNKESE